MRKIISISLIGILIMQLTACGNTDAGVITIPERSAVVNENINENINEEHGKEEVTRLEAQDFMPLFRAYFSLKEEDILFLNQSPKEITQNYWELKEQYVLKTRSLLGDYLSLEALAELGRGYMNKVVDFPKKLEINEYVTYGSAQVQSVDVLSMRNAGENKIYEVAVTTINDVKDVIAANKEYIWDNSRMYYVKKGEAKEPIPAFDTMEQEFEMIKNSYLLTEDQDSWDHIRLVQKYWVEVEPSEALKVVSIKEAVPVKFEQETKQKATNIKHVERIPFNEEPTAMEVQVAQEVFETLFNAPKEFYSYLEKAHDTGYDSFLKALKQGIEVSDDLRIRESNYQQAFHKSINPYKDMTQDFRLLKQHIQLISSPAATKKQARYKVIIPVKTVEADFSESYYEYEYFIGFEEGKIEVIQFIARQPISQEGYEKL